MIDYFYMLSGIAMIAAGIGILISLWRIGKIPDETILNYASKHSSSVKSRLWVKILMSERIEKMRKTHGSNNNK